MQQVEFVQPPEHFPAVVKNPLVYLHPTSPNCLALSVKDQTIFSHQRRAGVSEGGAEVGSGEGGVPGAGVTAGAAEERLWWW